MKYYKISKIGLGWANDKLVLDLLKKSSLHQPSFCSQQEDSVEDLRQECVEAPLKEKQHHRKQVEFLKLSHEGEYLADGMIYISIDAHWECIDDIYQHKCGGSS